MTTLLYSSQMEYFHLYLPYEIAAQTVAEIGSLNSVMFVDANLQTTSFNRLFVANLKRLENSSRQLRYIQSLSNATPSLSLNYSRSRSQLDIDYMEQSLPLLELRILHLQDSIKSLNSRFLMLKELKLVLLETASFFNQSSIDAPFDDQSESLVHGSGTLS